MVLVPMLWVVTVVGATHAFPGNPWHAEGGAASARFGSSTSTGDLNGDGFSDLIVGSPYFDGTHTDQGRVSIYLGSATGFGPSPTWTLDGTQPGGLFGFSVACVGDFNADGFDDLIVGAPYQRQTVVGEGIAWFYWGRATNPPQLLWWTFPAQANAHFGWSVAAAGDVDGDGDDDILVGGPDFDVAGHQDAGMARLVGGNPDDVPEFLWDYLPPGPAQARVGYDVAGTGDLDGDGFDDAAFGAPGVPEVRIFHGSAAGLPSSPDWTLSEGATFEFGTCVASAGDLNGDGFADAAIGCEAAGSSSEGRIVLLAGNAGGPPYATFVRTGSLDGGHFGADVAGAGDVNGDGLGDLLVGAPLAEYQEVQEGAVYLYYGDASSLVSDLPVWSAEGDHPSAQLGASVCGGRDTNGDTYSDISAGAPRFSNGAMEEGRVSVWFGADDPTTHVIDEAPPAIGMWLTGFPSPARGPVVFSYDVRRASLLTLSIVDVSGRAVTRFADLPSATGKHELTWDGRDAHGARVPSGTYFAILTGSAGTRTARVVIAR
jgi:hypothetical protein